MKGDGRPSRDDEGRRPLPRRDDGYVPIEDYAVLGDGRSAVLVAADGQVDWWPVPALDSPPACAALLDPRNGGHFSLRPEGDAQFSRRYVPGTNVLETTYWLSGGSVRVTDSLNTGIAGRLPWSELARRVEGVQGEVDIVWELVMGNRFGQARPFVYRHGRTPVIKLGDQMLAVVTDCAEVLEVGDQRVAGRIVARPGKVSLVAVVASDDEPLFVDNPQHVQSRLDRSIEDWKRWSAQLPTGGPWSVAVERSALALKVLRSEAEGAIAAAATTSLPERLGGPKNYDYRFAWIRDTSFVLDAFMELGLNEEVHASVSWMLAALQRSASKLHVFYTLDGETPAREVRLEVPGYMGSQPVRSGNSARDQLQLGVYGDLFDMVGRYVRGGHVLDDGTGQLLAQLADQCADQWLHKDSGIWELPDLEHYTISKIGCWVAMDRAARLAKSGQLPGTHADRWAYERDAIKKWVDMHCWSSSQCSYTFYEGTEDLDASVLLAGRTGFERGERLASTIAAVEKHLRAGQEPLFYRYSGMDKEEGAFVACSFWMVSALAHNGQRERAAELMDAAVRVSNDLGLLSEQIDPATGAFLGNVPQALSHLALVQAAHALGAEEASGARAR